MRSYKELDVWTVSMALVEACYRETQAFPRDEAYGMTTQIRRAATSIPANIAEGYGRDSTGDYIRFLRVSQGSTKELEMHVMISERVGLLPHDKATTLLGECERVSKMLRNLIRALESKR